MYCKALLDPLLVFTFCYCQHPAPPDISGGKHAGAEGHSYQLYILIHSDREKKILSERDPAYSSILDWDWEEKKTLKCYYYATLKVPTIGL